MKRRHNAGKVPSLYFWRDKTGLEIDCIVEKANEFIPIEMKSAKTINSEFFESLHRFCHLAEVAPSSGYLVYGGDEEQKRQNGHVIGWKQLSKISL